MLNQSWRARALLFAIVFVCACSPRVFSPPTGTIPIESARPVGEGKVGIRAEGTRGGAVFGPDIYSARASASYGINEQLDVNIAPSLLWVGGSRSGDSHPGSYALRGGLKYARVKHVALTGGLGAGGSAAGAFVSPDLGGVLAWENPYLVPFGSARGLMSIPLAARHVHFTTDDGVAGEEDDADELPDRFRLKPRFTYGFQFALGLRLPLPWETLDKSALFRPSFQCALGVTRLRDSGGQLEGYGMIGCGIELLR
jgi:hypothetical protein